MPLLSESAFELCVLVVIAGGTGWMLWLALRNTVAEEEKLRVRAWNQFRATTAAFPALHLEFDGGRAEILGSHETKYLAALLASNYVLSVSARMPDGIEYEFKSDSGGRPWVICRSRSDAHAVKAHADF